MKIFTLSFAGRWIGGDMVIVAETRLKALNAARRKIDAMGFGDENGDLVHSDLCEVSLDKASVSVLSDGDY